MTNNSAQTNLSLYSRLSRLARSEQTSVVYDARAALAACYFARNLNAALIASGIKRDRTPMRWMSAVAYRHSIPEASR